LKIKISGSVIEGFIFEKKIMAVQVSTDSDFSNLIASNQKVIVKYYADWCGSCKLFAPKFRRMSEDAANEGILFLDVNAEQNPEARKMAGVNNLPFIATYKAGSLSEGFATGKEEKVLEMLGNLKSN
jgi:thiol-disulfide isomerase/thioredoxin